MLTIELHASEYIDDFADTAQSGVLVRGDVYDGAIAQGHYVARWFPEAGSEVEMLVTLVDAVSLKGQCSLAFRCARKSQPRMVEPGEIWIDGSPHCLPMSVHEAHAFHQGAGERARAIAALVATQDALVRDYIDHAEEAGG